MDDQHLLLSVLLIVGNQRRRAQLSLQSVLDQSCIEQIEVLLIDCGQADVEPLLESAHPRVRLIRLSSGLPAGQVRLEAIRQARAPLVVFLEEHAQACPGWADAILKAHHEPWAGVGPELINGNPTMGISAYLELMYYPLWSPPAQGGVSPTIALHNSAYKREVLLKYGERLASLIYPEILLQRQLVRDGYTLYVEPAMKILHCYETELWTIYWGDFQAHRSLGALRDTIFKTSLWKRVLRLMILPLVPWSRTLKLYSLLRHKRPDRLNVFWRGLIFIHLVNTAAASGEGMGMLFGAGRSAIAFLDYQISAVRRLPPDFYDRSLPDLNSR